LSIADNGGERLLHLMAMDALSSPIVMTREQELCASATA
jgi:hypothetical protein